MTETDAVAWQYRYRMWNTGDWSAWSVPTLDRPDSNDEWEWRALVVASPAVAPVAVSVKGLEWVKHPNVEAWRAETFLGLYQVWAAKGISWELAARESAGGSAPSVEAAKAAAQFDFNARILSSIIPSTTTKGGETEEYQCSYCKAHFDDPTTLCGLEKCDLVALSAQDTDGVAKS